MSAHPVQWVTASPLWPDVLQGEPSDAATRTRMRKPALLRFASDSFMDDLTAVLADDPAKVAALEAKPESFRPPPPGEGPEWKPDLQDLKLFQAAHGHFYLVAATLACRVPGLPEHPADPARGETVSFVIRRIHEEAEWAWTGTDVGAHAWTEVAAGEAGLLGEREDRLPLFPVNYEHRGRRRRLYVGLVPTSSRETFGATGVLSPLTQEDPPPTGAAADPRRAALEGLVLAPMRGLPHGPTAASPLTGDDRTAAAEAAKEKRIEMSRFALVELIGLLRTSIPALFAAITDEEAQVPGGAAGVLHARFTNRHVGDGGTTWAAALGLAWKEHLEIAGERDGPITLNPDLSASDLGADELGGLFADALPPIASTQGAAGTAAASGTAGPAQAPKLDVLGEARYLLRCAYRRPECGPLRPDVVSDPSDEFTIAPFYDLDAPVRPVMVSLPIDTSIKDLRRFGKGVSFLISDELRKQMSRASSLKESLDGNVGSGQQFNVGVICSFSIPIITIVALILLMLIVSLLNFVFGWLPYLRICLPFVSRRES